MKKILILSDINSAHTRMWCENLIKRGFEIAIFSLSQKQTDWLDNLPVVHKSYGIKEGKFQSNSRFAKIQYFSVKKEVQEFFRVVQPDIVHAHYASSYGTLARQLGFDNTVLSLWGSDVYEFPKRSVLHRILYKKAVRFPKIVCSTSKAMAFESEKYVQRNYEVTPFGIDCDFFVSKKQENRVLTFGTVKSLEKVYGVDRLIQSYARYQKQSNVPSRLLIFGKGSEESNLKVLVEKLGIEQEVEFRGFIKKEGLVEAFNELDVFFALSRQESFGVAVLEAQACGIPVIVSNVGGLPEVVSDQSGFVVNGNDYTEIIEKMLLLEDKSSREKMGRMARKFVQKNYEIGVCVDKMVGIYNSIE